MDFYDELFEQEKNTPVVPRKTSNGNGKFIIIIGVIVLLALVIWYIMDYNTPLKRYKRMENKMVDIAKEYVLKNNINVEREIFLDAFKVSYNLESNCNDMSGVFFNGTEYTPYLSCTDYKTNFSSTTNSITLEGNEVTILAQGIPFYDMGYQSNNEVLVSGEVGSEEGVYDIKYINKTNNDYIIRKVIIINNLELYNRYPSIILNGDALAYGIAGKNYDDPGVKANDTIDGDISSKVNVNNNIDINTPGEYQIVYSITNSRGYTNTISRMVKVINSEINLNTSYVINPSTKVNTKVSIDMKIFGDNYAYTILPNNEKTEENTFSYEVEENGKYNFAVYDKGSRKLDTEVVVDNIDRTLPQAICEAVIYDKYTNFIVNTTSSKAISSYEYLVNNKSVKKDISSSYIYNSNNVSDAKVIIKDSIGNKNTIKCELDSELSYKTDYSKSFVYIKGDNNNTLIKKYSLADYLKSSLYAFLSEIDLAKYSRSQQEELFKTYFVVEKAIVFSKGGYSVISKQSILKNSDTSYCDIYEGCQLATRNNKIYFLPIDSFGGNTFLTKPAMPADLKEIVDSAYEKTKKEVLIANSFNDVLAKYPFIPITSFDYYEDNILSDVGNNLDYQKIIAKRFTDYKIYNIANYSSKFAEALKIEPKFWWPVGSSIKDSRGLYSQAPTSIEILHNYGGSTADNKVYDGMGIKGECNQTNVIATSNGKVEEISYNDNYGNYIVISYSKGVKFLYGSLAKETITVRTGDRVNTGQLIAKVGMLSNKCMLYVKTSLNGIDANPLEYISATKPRPAVANGDQIIYVPDKLVKRSVCLSLLESGFSVPATAGIMANIEKESNFILNIDGDNYTSLGLMQWHKDRKTNLLNFCGDEVFTVKCQLEFMLDELQNVSRFSAAYNAILKSNDAYNIGSEFCYKFEAPAEPNVKCPKRGELAKTYVNYVKANCGGYTGY